MGEKLWVSVFVQLLWITSHSKFYVLGTSVGGVHVKDMKVEVSCTAKKCEPGRRFCAMCATAQHS